MKLIYQKPELIELAGMEAFGDCNGNGSGDDYLCYANGNNAVEGVGACMYDGNTAAACTYDGNAVIT